MDQELQERRPLLQDQQGPIPANRMAAENTNLFDSGHDGDDDDEFSECKNFLYVLCLLGGLLAALIGIVYIAHRVHECHHRHEDPGSDTLMREAERWNDELIDTGLFKPTNSTAPTRTQILRPKRSKTYDGVVPAK